MYLARSNWTRWATAWTPGKQPTASGAGHGLRADWAALLAAQRIAAGLSEHGRDGLVPVVLGVRNANRDGRAATALRPADRGARG